ncbi:MAG: FAD-binding oxidoreductase [Mucilaginibacter polytrichastri]|nr:FAD-binding oxidoreductase [Mucilaginibacter polytrichastri]
MKKKIANWGNYPVMESDERQIRFEDEIGRLVTENPSLLARGNGRCYGDAALAAKTINTVRFDKVLGFDINTGIFDCQAGITLDQILEIIVPKGWFLPVTPGTKFVTIGGALASDVHGKNHHLEGSISNHVLDFDLILADGEPLKVTREDYPLLFEATAGGMGLTGVISRVRFQLKPIKTSYIRQKQIKAANLTEILSLFEQYHEYTYSVAWIDCLSTGKSFGRSILMLGEHAEEHEVKNAGSKLKAGKKPMFTLPFYFPSFALNKLTIKAFNWLYYNKNLKKVQDSVTHYEPFFYPLDALNEWNKMYGKKGFVQYQFVLPYSGKQGLIDILTRISKKGLGSFLAVLKVFGKQESMISFPFEGYTLALDFPVSDALFPFLDELDVIVEEYGGRVYMSKDARMDAGFFARTYPRLNEFRAVLDQYNPQQKFSSEQAHRLHIFSN